MCVAGFFLFLPLVNAALNFGRRVGRADSLMGCDLEYSEESFLRVDYMKDVSTKALKNKTNTSDTDHFTARVRCFLYNTTLNGSQRAQWGTSDTIFS